ncbi:MAG: hypothetical protein WAN36_01325, partial [Calditrichia bacterium]
MFLLIVVLTLLLSCERQTNPADPNLPPNTTLANIPVEGDTLFALMTLHWDGEDADGFLTGYEYRYITYHMSDSTGGTITDSLVQDWEFTRATSITIPFESSATLNYQRFQVRAVDDDGMRDPTPAEKLLYTVQTVFPQSEIFVPADQQQFFVKENTTDWWQGVPLSFNATDQDGEVVEY